MSLTKLSQLKKGQTGLIELKHPETLPLILLEMGFTSGEKVAVEMLAPLGDPMAVNISGYYVGIRKAEADLILVQLID